MSYFIADIQIKIEEVESVSVNTNNSLLQKKRDLTPQKNKKPKLRIKKLSSGKIDRPSSFHLGPPTPEYSKKEIPPNVNISLTGRSGTLGSFTKSSPDLFRVPTFSFPRLSSISLKKRTKSEVKAERLSKTMSEISLGNGQSAEK